MLSFNRIAMLALTALIATGANAIGPSGSTADYGAPASDNAAERTIRLQSGTKYVNVVNGETVKFTVNGKSFSWHVETFRNVTQFDLRKIAPQNMPAANVRVFVAPNPLYIGG